MDYDRNIHHNPDAMAWAKFFVETTKDMGREVFCDEGYMVGWFANAMMAMHDSIKPHESADEIERLREALNILLNGVLPNVMLTREDYRLVQEARAALKDKQ
jgi:hypothetical protein